MTAYSCPVCESAISGRDCSLLGGCPECGASATQMFDALDVGTDTDDVPPSVRLREVLP